LDVVQTAGGRDHLIVPCLLPDVSVQEVYGNRCCCLLSRGAVVIWDCCMSLGAHTHTRARTTIRERLKPERWGICHLVDIWNSEGDIVLLDQ